MESFECVVGLGTSTLPPPDPVPSALGCPASQPGHAPALQEPLMTSSRSSKSLSRSPKLPHQCQNQPSMSPEAHFEANSGASSPQNPFQKHCVFFTFLLSLQLSILHEFGKGLGRPRRHQNRANSYQDDSKMTPRRAKLELKRP